AVIFRRLTKTTATYVRKSVAIASSVLKQPAVLTSPKVTPKSAATPHGGVSSDTDYFTSQQTASRRETGLLCQSLLLQVTSRNREQQVEEKQDCCVKVCFCRLLHKPAKYKTRLEQLYSDTFCCFN
ncbi:hypothetical protein RRG08_042196, partial [Elysia crispata]